jgi:ABC-type antimicrobial peptide transport system permease subunit
MFEFGVLRAVGTPPVAMGRLVMFESSALGLIGVLCGAVLGLLVILICRQTGLDYSGVEFAGATMREALYPIFRARQFILYPAVVLVLTTLIGLYPAAYAARLVPAVAMRRAM